MPDVKFPEINISKDDLNRYLTKGQDKVQEFLSHYKEPVAAKVAELAERLRPSMEKLPFADKLGSMPPAREVVDRQFERAQRLVDANRRWATERFSRDGESPAEEAVADAPVEDAPVDEASGTTTSA